VGIVSTDSTERRTTYAKQPNRNLGHANNAAENLGTLRQYVRFAANRRRNCRTDRRRNRRRSWPAIDERESTSDLRPDPAAPPERNLSEEAIERLDFNGHSEIIKTLDETARNRAMLRIREEICFPLSTGPPQAMNRHRRTRRLPCTQSLRDLMAETRKGVPSVDGPSARSSSAL